MGVQSAVSAVPGGGTLSWREQCSCCGGGMDVSEDLRVLECGHCGRQLLRDPSRTRPLFLPFQVTAEATELEMKRWLRQEGHRATGIGDVKAVLVPYWRVTRPVLDWPAGLDPGAVEERPTARTSQPPLVVSALADASPVIEAAGTRVHDVHCLPLDPNLAPRDVLYASPVGDLPDPGDEDQNICTLVGNGSLVFQPIYVLRYTFRSDHHTVIACGINGEVLGSDPGDLEEEFGFSETLPQLTAHAPTPLRCPGCRSSMRGGPRDALFLCIRCRRGWRLQPASLVETTMMVAKGEGTLLPFWHLEGAPISNVTTPGISRQIYVPAWTPCPASLTRRLASTLTERMPDYEEGGRWQPDARSCTMSIGDAVRLASRVAGDQESEGAEDGVVRVTGYDVLSLRIVWVPFQSEKGYLVDRVSGITISEAIFSDG